jgi:hypothetical protein
MIGDVAKIAVEGRVGLEHPALRRHEGRAVGGGRRRAR